MVGGLEMADNLFDRRLKPGLLNALMAEAEKPGWWRDVLDDPSLIIALRGSYLNVYWQGQSLFRVSLTRGKIVATTHEKYLVDPALAGQIELRDGAFQLGELMARGFLRDYGRGTLAAMKKAANLHAGAEKRGVHLIATRNTSVVDVEIALPGKVDNKQSPRIDIAAFEDFGAEVRLAFWEAKCFDNTELWATDDAHNVIAQIGRYRAYLQKNAAQVEASYTAIASDLCRLASCSAVRQARLHHLVSRVATGQAPLRLGDAAQVGLLVFDFDQAQRDHPRWTARKNELSSSFSNGLALKAAGDARNIRL